MSIFSYSYVALEVNADEITKGKGTSQGIRLVQEGVEELKQMDQRKEDHKGLVSNAPLIKPAVDLLFLSTADRSSPLRTEDVASSQPTGKKREGINQIILSGEVTANSEELIRSEDESSEEELQDELPTESLERALLAGDKGTSPKDNEGEPFIYGDKFEINLPRDEHGVQGNDNEVAGQEEQAKDNPEGQAQDNPEKQAQDKPEKQAQDNPQPRVAQRPEEPAQVKPAN